MTTSFTQTRFLALALSILCATGSVFAQQSRSVAPAKKPATAVRPAASVQATAKPVAKATPAPAAATPAPAKATEAPAAVPQKPQPGVQTASTRTAPATKLQTSAPSKAFSASRQKYLNAGIGLAAYYGGGIPLGVSFEIDVKDNISVGASLDYARYGYRSGGYRWNYNFVYAGARGSYHLGELLNLSDSKLDPYVGATIGFRYSGYTDNYGYGSDYYSPYNSGLFFGGHLGARYMFTPKVGAFSEVGYGVSALRVGITAKL